MALWSAALLLLYVCRGSLGVKVKVEVEVDAGRCYVNLPFTTRPLQHFSSVLWTRGSEEVHLRVDEVDDPRKQSRLFQGRTQMKPHALQNGDLTLRLSFPTATDEGTYTGVAREGTTEVERVTVELRVKVGVVINGITGSSVSLPFHMEALRSEARVKWTWTPEGSKGSKEVHLRLGGRDDLTAQSSQFKGRTWMNPDALQTGNLTLVLSSLTDTDRGSYTCVVTEGATELGRTTVKLSVITEGVSGPTVAAIGAVIGAVIISLLIVIFALILRRKKQTGERFRDASIDLFNPRPTPVL